MNGDVTCPVNPLATHIVYSKGNMENITKMIPIDISKTLGVVENVFIREDCSPKEIQVYTELFKEFHDIFAQSYEEILGIDPRIVEYEIRNYHDGKPIWKNLHLLNHRKTTTIKYGVEKLIKADFIYPVQLTEWVSNPFPINKNKGTI